MNYIVTSGQVRDYLQLNSPGTSSKYSDDTINSNILAATQQLEHWCRRWFADRQGVTWATTTMLATQVSVPGFRTITSCTWGGSTMSVGLPGVANDTANVWALYEPHMGVESPVIVALQFRPWRTDGDRPWWYADPKWWDKGLDSPYYPGNYGGGWAYTSMPNDLVVVGDGGYAAGSEPQVLRDVIKVFAAWKTLRPASILGDVALTPGGAAVEYQSLPPEVRDFVADWAIGTQVVSVG